ncbi:MAG: metal-dependent transcriptional regulator, partial [Anaerococcus sp.]
KIYLTEQGLKIGEKLISIHRLWEKFLEEVLDFPADKVHNQADLLEHVTSDELVESLNKYLNYPKNCPHGRIIYINAKENI